MPRLTILHTNDLHTQIAPLPRLAAAVNQVRNESSNILLVDSGDAFADGDPETQHLMFQTIQLLDYDAISMGDGDDFIWKSFSRDELEHLPFTLFAPNLSASAMYEVDGAKVGIVGAFSGTTLENARKYAGELRDTCDLVIALTHFGLDADLQLAQAVEEIDIILGGHHHRVLNPPLREGRSTICQHGGHGRYLGRLDVDIHPGSRYQLANYAIIDLRRIQPDPEVQRFLWQQKVTVNDKRILLGTWLGQATQSFAGENADRMTPLGIIVADAIKEVAETDIALMFTRSMNSYLRQGAVRVIDVYDVVYQNLEIVTWLFAGGRLKTLLEQSLIPDSRGHPVRFYAAGMELEYPNGGTGDIKATINQHPLQYDAIYTVATDIFVGSGHHFALFKDTECSGNTGIGTREALIGYIRRHGKIPPEV